MTGRIVNDEISPSRRYEQKERCETLRLAYIERCRERRYRTSGRDTGATRRGERGRHVPRGVRCQAAASSARS